MDDSRYWYLGLAPTTAMEVLQVAIEAMYDREMHTAIPEFWEKDQEHDGNDTTDTTE